MRILKFRKYNKLGMEYFDWLPDDRGNEIWMQFTGLLDKKGKEIYEGDIVYRVEIVPINNKLTGVVDLKFENYYLVEYVSNRKQVVSQDRDTVNVTGFLLKEIKGFFIPKTDIYVKGIQEPAYSPIIQDGIVYRFFNEGEGSQSIEIIGNIYENPDLIK